MPGFHFFIQKWDWTIHLNWGFFRKLFKFNPDIIIIDGYDALAYWQAFFLAKILRKKIILWSSSTVSSSKMKKGLFAKIKQFIIQKVDSYITYGEKSKEYLEFFGAAPEKIHKVFNTVDMAYFKKGFARRTGPSVLIYVGRLHLKKGLLNLIRAAKKHKLLMIGDGPDRKILEKEAGDNVAFLGFKQQTELPKYYAQADVFVFPTFQDPWGLVINEALAAGLYVLCSKYAGAAELINENNGLVFSPDNIEELKNILNNLDIGKIREQRQLIAQWASENLSIQKSAELYVQAINKTLFS